MGFLLHDAPTVLMDPARFYWLREVSRRVRMPSRLGSRMAVATIALFIT
jgi:hypothetical protein